MMRNSPSIGECEYEVTEVDAMITKGCVVKIHNWYGVVLETHTDDQDRLSIIQVQTARNIFRGHGPEYVDVRLLPEAIELATLADLQQEIETHQRLLNGAVIMTPKNWTAC